MRRVTMLSPAWLPKALRSRAQRASDADQRQRSRSRSTRALQQVPPDNTHSPSDPPRMKSYRDV